MNYKEQLLTPQWRATSHQILSRDLHTCTKCGSNKMLQVHHTGYIEGKMAWEYPGMMLTTLCKTCHKSFHRLSPHDDIVEATRIIRSAVAGIKGLSRG